ncbi:MAG: hypothetical protein E6Q90_10145 [Actinobacteria bacterium]|nr:MAG: hypothetical protein E6Q90_10145 [Actinomycetota bacterium]
MLAQRSALEPGVRVRPPGPRRWRLVAAVLAGLAVAGLALLIGLVAGPMSAQALASAGPQPQVATVGMAEDVAMAPNGSFALVPNRAVDTVSRVQTSDNSITATIAVAGRPTQVDIAPDGSFAYVTTRTSGRVARIRLSDNTVVASIVVGGTPDAVDIAPNGQFAYVLDIAGGRVVRIRTSDNAVVAFPKVTTGTLGQVSIAPDSSYAYVASDGAAGVGGLLRVRTSDDTVVSTTAGGFDAVDISPSGAFAYVTDNHSVHRVNTTTNAIGAEIWTGNFSRDVEISPDGTFAYATVQLLGDAVRITTATDQVSSTQALSTAVWGLAIAPDSSFTYLTSDNMDRLYRLEAPKAPTGVVVTPGDASASIAFTAAPNDLPYTGLQYSLDAGSTWTSQASVASPLVLTGLVNGSSKTLRLRLVNQIGVGAMSTASTFVVGQPPGVPTVTALTPNANGFTVDFTPPASAGSGTLANYQYSLDQGVTWLTRSPASTASPLVIGGLARGAHVQFQLRAVNNYVPGPATPVLFSTTGTIPVGARATAVAVAPNQTFAYVANRLDNTVTKVRTADDAAVGTIPVGSGPADIEFRPDGTTAYVVNTGSNSVSVINTATSTVVADVTVGTSPVAIAVAPSGAFAYVVNRGSGTLSRINLADNTVSKVFSSGGTWPSSVAISPDGTAGFVANGWNGTVVRFTTAAEVTTNVYTVGTPYVVGEPWGGGPARIAINATHAYVTDDRTTALTRIPLAGGSPELLRLMGGKPTGIAFKPASTEFYVTDASSDLVWRLGPSSMLGEFHAGQGPTDVAFSSAGFAYVANGSESTVSRLGIAGAPTAVVATAGNASASVAFAGPVSDGGSAITNYKYAVSANGGSTWGPWTALAPADAATPVTVPGLTNGTTYLIKVLAVTALGDGSASAPSAPFTPITTPGAPGLPSATPGNASASVAFSAPASNGGSAITNYQFALSTNGGSSWGPWTAVAPLDAVPPVTITGLTNGTSYLVKVRAVNAAGGGAESLPSSAFVPKTVPAAPTLLVPTPGNASVSVAFAAPASNGGSAVTNYKYATSTNGGSTWGPWTALSPADTTSPVTVPGLGNGTAYLVKLRAMNIVGDGAESSPTTPFVPRTLPGAPTLLNAVGGDGTITANFVAPGSDGGAAISGYQYSLDGGTTWHTPAPPVTTTPLLISGLPNWTPQHVALRAVNTAGSGPASAVVDAMAQPPGLVFSSVTPARVADTRLSYGGSGPVQPGEPGMRVLSVAATQDGGLPVVPVGAAAVVVNITVPSPQAAGHLRLMPGDAVAPGSASAVNFRAGETIANGITARIDASRSLKVYASAATDVIIDVVGYFAPPPPPAGGAVGESSLVAPQNAGAGRFTAIEPVRVYDSASDAAGLLGVGESRPVSAATTQDGLTPVTPAGAGAVAYNLTVVRPEGAGHLRVMPGDVDSSPASAVNWARAGEVIANGLTVRVDADRRIRVFNASSEPVRILVDIVGYYSASGSLFYPVDPVRVLDTRTASGGLGAIGAGEANIRTASVATSLPSLGAAEQVPPGATAVASNFTVTATTSGGHMRVFPAGSALPTASTINWPDAGYSRAHGTVTAISPSREVSIYNGSTSADALLDVLGFYR